MTLEELIDYFPLSEEASVCLGKMADDLAARLAATIDILTEPPSMDRRQRPMDDIDISALIGKTITKIDNHGESLSFTCSDNTSYKMHHEQNCCESVYLEDICGDLADLMDSPVVNAEESISDENPPDYKPEYQEYQESFTWTFYRISTIHGTVTLRWYGESNGYYSESVSFVQQ